jgi:hypothetical protein
VDSKGGAQLDSYGFPRTALANRLLAQRTDFGESLEDLESKWQGWLHNVPFDARVAAALATLHERRLSKLDPQRDAAAYQRLERRLSLTRGRAERYGPSAFRHEPGPPGER